MASSCTKCDKNTKSTNSSTNNIQNCMLKMQDGRAFTDYRPRCTINYQLKNTKNMNNSYDSRMFLINNAESLMKENETIVKDKNVCKSCFGTNEVGTMLPEKNMVQCNDKTCNFQANVNPNGIGSGRIYN